MIHDVRAVVILVLIMGFFFLNRMEVYRIGKQIQLLEQQIILLQNSVSDTNSTCQQSMVLTQKQHSLIFGLVK